jgi:hypothetical protein
MEKGKEFRTEITEISHRDHGEFCENLSVPSVVEWFDGSDRDKLRALYVKCT